MNRLPPFPVSTDGELRSHDGPLRSTNGFATLGYEFDDNLVDGRMRPRVVGCVYLASGDYPSRNGWVLQ